MPNPYGMETDLEKIVRITKEACDLETERDALAAALEKALSVVEVAEPSLFDELQRVLDENTKAV